MQKAKILDKFLYEYFRKNDMSEVCVLQCYYFKRIIPSCSIVKRYVNSKLTNRSTTHYQIEIDGVIFDPAGRYSYEKYGKITNISKVPRCKYYLSPDEDKISSLIKQFDEKEYCEMDIRIMLKDNTNVSLYNLLQKSFIP
jgi:hypothetical protein